ncbi:MAG: ferrochelatase [Gammaproteobacteria bacterium]|nr:ferrochelatase [Gammaproteobacteria bacterium]
MSSNSNLTNNSSHLGVLLCNLGTPDAPTAAALRRYLAEFLWDPRIVEIPRLPWWLILHGIILRTRPKKSAEKYRSIWTDQGSPLMVISRNQQQLLQNQLSEKLDRPVTVMLGMRYGNPSIQSALEALRTAGCDQLVILPLYPQNSCSTTASTFDAVADVFGQWRGVPSHTFISDYHTNERYIVAVAASIEAQWQQREPAEKLIFSFHGTPRSYRDKGDPYYDQCQQTAKLVAEKMGLDESRWQVTFQSRFGKAEWLKPYTDVTLKQLAKDGVKSVDIISPGFSVDCLETLEELGEENREYFLESGGESYNYIPALNDQPDHIEMMVDLVLQNAPQN